MRLLFVAILTFVVLMSTVEWASTQTTSRPPAFIQRGICRLCLGNRQARKDCCQDVKMCCEGDVINPGNFIAVTTSYGR
ncbi:hypothetical protein AVEN_224962-1 [Araneus ventricosus]|uniref:Uncharacterized protein n=1 Tax=Araneus ventricosus TaxID=182803 RepID=A0A4Y2PBV8_ARAVE|nr:hypothetical protein AVEN_66618-1 [Araneus ventricosus]GBN49468.1 hypothetical protein AVEN_224962-1 [Araneus ventricosus]